MAALGEWLAWDEVFAAQFGSQECGQGLCMKPTRRHGSVSQGKVVIEVVVAALGSIHTDYPPFKAYGAEVGGWT